MARRKFHNQWPHPPQRFLDIFRWKFGLIPPDENLAEASDQPAPWIAIDPSSIAMPPPSGWRIAWLGHASFLLQGCGLSILIDPIFSDHCSPIPVSSLKRKIPPACSLSDLPPIDFILLTHSHYDHLDLPTLRQIPHSPEIVIAEGHASWLSEKLGRKVSELPWHRNLQLTPDVRITATPAQHFSARTPFDRDRGHWCGWIIEGGGMKLWHAGDCGYSQDFTQIGERHGPIDFAMIPIGAYQPRAIMKSMHMNPEEAVQAFQDARCREAIAMHWGTFVLTDEPMAEPPLRLRNELARKNLPPEIFSAAPVGTLLHLD